MKIPIIRIYLVLAVLAAASLACNLPQRAENIPPTQQPVDPAELEQLEDQLRDTLTNPEAGEVTVTVTQEQLTAFLAMELADQDEQLFTEPVVVLTNGQMEVYGKLSQNGIQANIKMVLQPSIDANGNPTLDLTSMDLGAFPVPETVRSRFENMVDGLLDQYLTQYSEQIQITAITISEGEMTITGIRP